MMTMMHKLRSCFTSLYRCERGVAIFEFLLAAPFLIILFFGVVEVTRYFLVIEKAEKTLDMITDVVSQAQSGTGTEITTARLNRIMGTLPWMMNPYPTGANSKVILTNVTLSTVTGSNPKVRWQYCGGGTLVQSSVLGPASSDVSNPNNATLPGGFTLLPGEEVLFGEFFYGFEPLMQQDIIGDILINRIVVYVPRLGTLTTYAPHTC